MFRKFGGAILCAAFALAGPGAAWAGQNNPVQPPSRAFNECGLLRNCFGPDRDLLVDRLYRVSCSEARDILDDRGFTKIRTVSCGGRLYRFTALWKGKTYRLSVSRATGDLVSMKRIN